MSTATQERAATSRLVSLPAVNLLPPEIHVRRRLRRVQGQLAGAGVVAVLLVVALFLLALSSVSSARGDLDKSRVEQTALQKKVDASAHVQQTYALVDQAHGLLHAAGGSEVLWSDYLGDLGPLLPAGTWLTKVTVTSATPTAPAGAPSAAAAPAQAVAQITFDGTALAHVNVASWLDRIAKERGWSNPYFTRSEEKLVGSTRTFTFTSTVTVTEAALSGRYPKAGG